MTKIAVNTAMGWRALGISLASAGVFAASAAFSWQYLGPAAPRTAEPPPPAFMTAALQIEPQSTWPHADRPVAFYDEMTALLTWGASIAVAARTPATEPEVAVADHRPAAEPKRSARKKQPKAREPVYARSEPETVEVQVRDRYGRVVQTRRVICESYDEPTQAYAPPRQRLFGPFLTDW